MMPDVIVSSNSALYPIIRDIHRELASCGAEPIRKEELPEIDPMLHEGLGVAGR
jgi:hypothetical protein